ncbi:MAG: glutamine--fructose-6-phosphate transaminase (isomerizing) [Candidatus Delongbacteria bacterium]|nr:glutamine--fructose-6-phosphate transaminase (isomerizing) [Candidatus Delongbacteria bacterium]
MCGIVGYIGAQKVLPILMDGLKRLEYRGYDSAGVAWFDNGALKMVKSVGKVNELGRKLDYGIESGLGIGHTRWATHGEPTEINAHPHVSDDGRVVLIHNGIIENYASLKQKLIERGRTFQSETDTEVLANLIAENFTDDLAAAVRVACNLVEGAYGIVVISPEQPDRLIAAKMGSPLVIGAGNGENFIASDALALAKHTHSVIILEDGEMAEVTRDNIVTKTIGNRLISKVIQETAIEVDRIEKGNYPHYMLKEIFEQTRTVKDAFAGRLLPEEGTAHLGGISDVMPRIENAERIIITACGTSYHAGLIGEYYLEELTRIPVEVEYASEFRYRNPILDEKTVVIAMSQSGETADTLSALKEARRKGALILGICNVVGSSIARETDAGIYIHAGPEIGVASTKAFTSQVVALLTMALNIGRRKHIGISAGKAIVESLRRLPEDIQQILDQADEIRNIALQLKEHQNALYLGRGLNYPVALEGALKLKEISYIHAEGYPAAEMKHGPIALIDNNMPVFFIAPRDEIHDKVISNIQEVNARKGYVISIGNPGDARLRELSRHLITVPVTHPFLAPLLTVIPLQLLAYYIAVERGCDVDQPRNLAKSVTVE